MTINEAINRLFAIIYSASTLHQRNVNVPDEEFEVVKDHFFSKNPSNNIHGHLSDGEGGTRFVMCGFDSEMLAKLMPNAQNLTSLISSTGEQLICVAEGLGNSFNNQLAIREPENSSTNSAMIAAGALGVVAIGAAGVYVYKRFQKKEASEEDNMEVDLDEDQLMEDSENVTPASKLKLS